jgi:hypothetical protein
MRTKLILGITISIAAAAQIASAQGVFSDLSSASSVAAPAPADPVSAVTSQVAVPEPSTYGLLLLGGSALVGGAFSRRKKTA